MRSRAIPIIFSLLLPQAVASVAWAESMQFAPDRDATLYEDLEGDVANGSGNFIFLGRTGPDGESSLRRTLVRFDVSAIPANAIINSVMVSFEIIQAPIPGNAVGGSATLHRVTAEWGEGASNPPGLEGQGTVAEPGDSTWLHRFYDSSLWDTPGGDFMMQASAIQGYSTEEETLSFSSTPDLARDVLKWVRSPEENFGWILLGNEGLEFTARKMESRERINGVAAQLTVDYSMPSPTDGLELELVTSVPVRPVVITNAGDGSERLFIVEQAGVIRIVDLTDDTLLATPFLDITSLVDDSGNEQGLLGLAFHPDFENNRQFYVNYTYDPGPGNDRTRVAMYRASVGDPNVAETTEEVILEFEQDFANHNGGDIHFDPDGYLVIASGDGGDGNDPNNRGQTLDTLLGKMLRIDVDTPSRGENIGLCGLVQNYSIPPGNPFIGDDEGCDEILHFGMRNPWRFSFDARTGDMFIGDVGQGLWEEISLAPPGSVGTNFGWKICEGDYLRGSDTQLCDFGELPIINYSSSGTGNCSVTGGYLYRGANVNLQGRYIYGDYCSARIWVATPGENGWTSEEWMESPPLSSISTFGQDEDCELYVADFGSLGTNGDEAVYRIVNPDFIDQSGFEEINCHQ